MKTQLIIPVAAILFGALTTVGCGADSSCADSDGETHLTQAMTDPSELSVMLHHVDRACSIVGDNAFHAYYIEGDMMMRSAPTDTTGGVEIVSVMAMMPDHGHGSTDDPTIDSDDSSYFDVYFQMPGTWELTVELTVPELETDTETVVFELEVSE